MRMGEVDVFPCVSHFASLSLSHCRGCNHNRVAPSSVQKGSQAENCLGHCDEKETFFTFTFLMQEKDGLSFAFDYTMFIKHASGSLITPAVWPRPTVCVFNQGVWKQSSHSDSARHLNLICGALMYACRPAYTNNPRPLFQFGHYMGLWCERMGCVGNNQSRTETCYLHTYRQTHMNGHHIYVSAIVRCSCLWLTGGSGSAPSSDLSADALRGTMPTLTLINLAGPCKKLKH